MVVAAALVAAAAPAGAATWHRSGFLSAPGALGAQAAIDSKGNMLVVWQHLRDRFAADVVVATRKRGGRWSAPATLTSEPGFIALRSNARGDVVIEMESQDSSNCEFARGCAEQITLWTGDVGGHFGDPVVITEHAAPSAGVALGPAGDVAVAWNDFHSGPGDVLVERRPPGGSFGAAEAIAGSEMTTPRVALDAQGRAVVAFTDFAEAQVRVFRAARSSGFSEAPAIDTGVRAAETGVTLAPSGAGVVYWSSGSTCVCAPLYGRFGKTFGAYPRQVKFAGGAGGNFLAGPGNSLLAFWAKQRDSHSAVFEPYAALGSASGGFGRKQRLAADGLTPSAAFDRRGHAAVLVEGKRPYVAQPVSHKRVRRLRLPLPGAMAMSPGGTLLVAGMSGKYPNQRVRAYWR